MNEIYTTLSVGLLLAWLVATMLRVFVAERRALMMGILVGFLAVFLARQTLFVQVLVSLLDPVALGLSFLIVRSFAKSISEIKPVPFWEQALFLLVLLGYFFASAGATMFDPYRYGYDLLWAGMVAATLCFYAGLRGYVGFALLPVAAQIVWLTGLGSSNYFDHLFSALMVPVLIVSIIGTLVANLRATRA